LGLFGLYNHHNRSSNSLCPLLGFQLNLFVSSLVFRPVSFLLGPPIQCRPQQCVLALCPTYSCVSFHIHNIQYILLTTRCIQLCSFFRVHTFRRLLSALTSKVYSRLFFLAAKFQISIVIKFNFNNYTRSDHYGAYTYM